MTIIDYLNLINFFILEYSPIRRKKYKRTSKKQCLLRKIGTSQNSQYEFKKTPPNHHRNWKWFRWVPEIINIQKFWFSNHSRFSSKFLPSLKYFLHVKITIRKLAILFVEKNRKFVWLGRINEDCYTLQSPKLFDNSSHD